MHPDYGFVTQLLKHRGGERRYRFNAWYLLAKVWELGTASTPGELCRKTRQERSAQRMKRKIHPVKQNLAWGAFLFISYLAGVELEESLLPKMVLYCGGPPGGAVDKHDRPQDQLLLLLW